MTDRAEPQVDASEANGIGANGRRPTRKPWAKGPCGGPGTRQDGSTKPHATTVGPEWGDGLRAIRISTRSRAVLQEAGMLGTTPYMQFRCSIATWALRCKPRAEGCRASAARRRTREIERIRYCWAIS